MSIRRRRLAAPWAAAIAIAAMTGCGTSASDETVAQVVSPSGVTSISKSSLKHWMFVEAVLLHNEQPTTAVPKGLLPDPSEYTTCIAYLRATPLKLNENGPTPTTAQLKSRCGQRYNELQVLTLNTLIGWYWTINSAAALGITASEAEVRSRLEEVGKRLFPGKGQFASYLKLTGQTAPDMLFRSRVQLFEVKIQEKAVAIAKTQGKAAIIKLAESLPGPKQWAAETSCSKGYVVSACKQYTGSESPGLPN